MLGGRVVELQESELWRVKPLLVELGLAEQEHFEDHPALSPLEMAASLGPLSNRFQGESHFFAVRAPDGEALAGFCWVVLFDPGTGLEGEVAEVYVAPEFRQLGLGDALLQAAVELFKERGVTLGYVWTRHDNLAAVTLYRHAGFEPTRQLVMTWYPATE